jgi:hypothetical protein
MDTTDIIKKIHELGLRHANIQEIGIDEFKEAELLEIEAEDLIISYCEEKGYQINGFPMDKRLLSEDELEEDYFSRERFQLYLDKLTLEKVDVAELTWCYMCSFWPAQYTDKQEYKMTIQEQIECGVFYEVQL